MTATDAPALFDLLPAVHRVRDARPGGLAGPLESLVRLIDAALDDLRDDIDALYDAWFIETCEEWLVPYIGELLGVRGLEEMPGARVSRRAFVANTIAYRRRKGTVGVLEDLARDVTGWPARAVEYFQLLGWTQHVNHVRPDAGGTAGLRDASALELVGGPFDRTAHTVDVRHVDNGRGDHNLPNIGVYLWRLRANPLRRSTAAAVAGDANLFTFDPLGAEVALRNRERPEGGHGLAEENHVPGRVRRRALYDELVHRAQETDFAGGYFDPAGPVLEVFVDGAETPAPVQICSLDVRARPLPAGVCVDPERGLVHVDPVPARGVEVSWAYGAPGELGGGPYARNVSIERVLDDIPEAVAGAHRLAPSGAANTRKTLTGALALIPDTARTGLVAVMDSRTYDESVTLAVAGGGTRVIAAGRWPAQDPELAIEERSGGFDPRDTRPHVRGDIVIDGAAGDTATAALDGLLIEGRVRVRAGRLDRLRIAHCTIHGPIVVEGANPELEIELDRCVAAGVDAGAAARLTMSDSIVVGAVDAGDATVDGCTIIGDTTVRSVDASESIFDGGVEVERRQTGCVRFSYVRWDAVVPRRFKCVPTSAADTARPLFVSGTLGDEGLGLLRLETSTSILAGAEDGDQMGALHFLQERRRLAQLDLRLKEYLRLGLEAGTFLVTQDRKGI